MRPLVAVLGLPLALALWAGSLWWGLPWRVSLHLEPRVQRPAAPTAPTARPDAPWLHLQVHQTLPGLEALAVGDAVAFDRYGLVAPAAGQTLCVALPQWHAPIRVTPVGGALPHGTSVSLALVPHPPAGCREPAGPLVSP
jgi:hypothetical protein